VLVGFADAESEVEFIATVAVSLPEAGLASVEETVTESVSWVPPEAVTVTGMVMLVSPPAASPAESVQVIVGADVEQLQPVPPDHPLPVFTDVSPVGSVSVAVMVSLSAPAELPLATVMS
jgi:hypothetical protein